MDNKTTKQDLLPLVNHNVHWRLLSSYLEQTEKDLLKHIRVCDEGELKKIQGKLSVISDLLSLPTYIRNNR